MAKVTGCGKGRSSIVKIGDLAYTQGGNLVVITHIEKEWANIVFARSGFLRTGYPRIWLRRKK